MTANVNYMRRVICPGSYVNSFKESVRYANSTAKGELRCTGCGQTHSETKRVMPGDFVPYSTKPKKFKKGKKPKAKGKGGKNEARA